jgi:hypothetical protein
MVRNYASTKSWSRPLRQKASRERFLQHFCDVIRTANVVVRHKPELAAKIWDGERSNIELALRLAEEKIVLEFDLAFKGRALFAQCLEWRRREKIYARAVALAEQADDVEHLWPMQVSHGRFYDRVNDESLTANGSPMTRPWLMQVELARALLDGGQRERAEELVVLAAAGAAKKVKERPPVLSERGGQAREGQPESSSGPGSGGAWGERDMGFRGFT